MASTYYAQLMRAYHWDLISKAIAASFASAREAFYTASLPSDGVFVEVNGVTANCAIDTEDEDSLIASVYLGQTFRDSPSGRFYAPWSNVPDSVRDADARWWDAFEKVADKYGLYLVNGEGDPTDTYIMALAPIDA